MVRKLKVFRAHLGFYDSIVAVPSQKAALEAWGAGTHEFRQGFAALTEDPELVRAANEKPGVVLRRQFGTKAPFEAEARLTRIPKKSSKNLEAEKRRKQKRAADKARRARNSRDRSSQTATRPEAARTRAGRKGARRKAPRD